MMQMIEAKDFLGALDANIENKNLSDAEFRDFVRKSLPIVIFQRAHPKNASATKTSDGGR